MILKKLILIAVGLLIWIPLKSQTVSVKPPCDSAISVCPATFDYFIRQDVLAKKYYTDKNKLSAEVTVLQFKLAEGDKLQKTTSDILGVTNQEKALTQKSYDLLNDKFLKLERNAKWLKFGCIAIGVTGVATTIYVAVKK